MKTIILPGYSQHNREWAYEIKNKMDLPDVVVHEWKHWTKGSFNVDYEVSEILKKVDDKKFNVIAKSVGTSVVMYLLQKLPDSINKIILCGIPINGFTEQRKDLFRIFLPQFDARNLMAFQNLKDNLGSFEKVRKFLHSIDPKIKVVEKPRSDHHYPYPKEFADILKKR